MKCLNPVSWVEVGRCWCISKRFQTTLFPQMSFGRLTLVQLTSTLFHTFGTVLTGGNDVA